MANSGNSTSATNSSHALLQDYSALFLLDFLARYSVDRCGAEDTVLVAFLSCMCVLPFWIWICSVILMLSQVELYWAMAKYTITLLSLCTVALLYLFNETPPVVGCGPDQSYPSPQVALSAYGATTYFYYAEMAPQKFRQWLHVVMVLHLAIVTLAVLWIGMASPAAVVAAALLGAVTAALLHEVLLNLSQNENGALKNFVMFLEKKLGVHTVDTVLQGATDVAQLLIPNPSTQSTSCIKDTEIVALDKFSMGYKD